MTRPKNSSRPIGLDAQNAPRPESAEASDHPTLWVDELVRDRRPGPALADRPDWSEWSAATRAVHCGQYDDPITGGVGTPIFQNTTYDLRESSYRSIEDGYARERLIYTRYGNPSQWAVQEKLASLENAESALVFSSGMAAITTTLMALLDKGSHVVTSRDLYGGTYNFLHEDLPQLGMSTTFVDPTDLGAVEAAIRPETKLLYFESLTNPLLKLVDIPGLVRLARKHKLRVVIDNTFLSPVNLRPLDLGVDVVVHSASKYLNGHSDLIAGVAAGPRKLLDRVWGQMLKNGGSLDPHACFMLERGLKTLPLRMERHNETAMRLARFLEEHPGVRTVHYPGRPSHAQFALAAVMLDGFSGMICFEVAGSDEDAERFMSHLRVPKAATSLGGVESLVSLPYNTSHASLTAPQLRAVGINPGCVRFSAGIEDPEDLMRDIGRALDTMLEGRRALDDLEQTTKTESENLVHA